MSVCLASPKNARGAEVAMGLAEPPAGTAVGRRSLLALGLAGALPAGAALAAGPVPGAGVDWAASPAVSLSGTRWFDLRMADGRTRRVFVMQPDTPAPLGGYPVLYVLDGNALFPLVAQIARMRSVRPDAARSDAAVIVGLGYATDTPLAMAERQRDYTPPLPAPAQDVPDEGGADRFLDDIVQQVRPLVAQALPIDERRQTLFGHSYGGLFVLHTLFSRPGLFNRHVAASPSIWWGQQAVLATRDRLLARWRGGEMLPAGLSLLLTVGSLEQRPLAAERTAIVRERRQIDAARELVDSLQGVAGLSARFRLFDGEDHGSAVVPAAVQALVEAQRRGDA